jgi:hypothetical protein
MASHSSGRLRLLPTTTFQVVKRFEQCIQQCTVAARFLSIVLGSKASRIPQGRKQSAKSAATPPPLPRVFRLALGFLDSRKLTVVLFRASVSHCQALWLPRPPV